MPQLAAASRKNDAFAFSWFFFLLVLWFPNDAWYAWYILGRTQRIRKSSSWIQRGPWEIQPRLHQKCQFYWEIHRYLLGISMGIIYIYIYQWFWPYSSGISMGGWISACHVWWLREAAPLLGTSLRIALHCGSHPKSNWTSQLLTGYPPIYCFCSIL